MTILPEGAAERLKDWELRALIDHARLTDKPNSLRAFLAQLSLIRQKIPQSNDRRYPLGIRRRRPLPGVDLPDARRLREGAPPA